MVDAYDGSAVTSLGTLAEASNDVVDGVRAKLGIQQCGAAPLVGNEDA